MPLELHGIQVGVGTWLTFHIYDQLRNMKPDRAVAEQHMQAFDPAAWEAHMHRIFGKAAQTLIDSEKATWRKNDPEGHAKRLDNIIAHWDEILAAVNEELPATETIEQIMQQAGMPMKPEDIGESDADVLDAFIGSRDIRDKYLSSSLLWDMGLLETFPLKIR